MGDPNKRKPVPLIPLAAPQGGTSQRQPVDMASMVDPVSDQDPGLPRDVVEEFSGKMVIPKGASIQDLMSIRAQDQSAWDQLGNWAVQSLAEIVGGTAEGVGYLFDFQDHIALAQGKEVEFANWLSDIGIAMKEGSREEFPIYQENPGEFNPGDSGWWFGNGVSIVSTLSLMLPTIGVVRGVSAAGRLLNVGNKLAKGAVMALEGIGGAVTSRIMENYMESSQSFKEIYAALLDKGTPEEEARFTASKQASNIWKANTVNLLTDIPQYMMLFGKAPNFSGLKKTGFAALASKKRFSIPLTMASEGLEEADQFIISAEGKQAALEGGKFFGAGFEDRLRDYVSDGEFQTSAFFGAIGGGVFAAVGPAANAAAKLYEDKVVDRYTEREILKGQLEDPETLMKMRDEELTGLIMNHSQRGTLESLQNDIELASRATPEELEDLGIKPEEFHTRMEEVKQDIIFAGELFNRISGGMGGSEAGKSRLYEASIRKRLASKYISVIDGEVKNQIGTSVANKEVSQEEADLRELKIRREFLDSYKARNKEEEDLITARKAELDKQIGEIKDINDVTLTTEPTVIPLIAAHEQGLIENKVIDRILKEVSNKKGREAHAAKVKKEKEEQERQKKETERKKKSAEKKELERQKAEKEKTAAKEGLAKTLDALAKRIVEGDNLTEEEAALVAKHADTVEMKKTKYSKNKQTPQEADPEVAPFPTEPPPGPTAEELDAGSDIDIDPNKPDSGAPSAEDLDAGADVDIVPSISPELPESDEDQPTPGASDNPFETQEESPSEEQLDQLIEDWNAMLPSEQKRAADSVEKRQLEVAKEEKRVTEKVVSTVKTAAGKVQKTEFERTNPKEAAPSTEDPFVDLAEDAKEKPDDVEYTRTTEKEIDKESETGRGDVASRENLNKTNTGSSIDYEYRRSEHGYNIFAYLSRIFNQWLEGDGSGSYTARREDVDDDLNKNLQDKNILDPKLYVPGTKIEFRYVEDPEMEVYEPGSDTKEATTWGNLKDRLNTEEDRVNFTPIGIYIDGNLVSFLHTPDWMHRQNIWGNIRQNKEDIYTIRKAIIDKLDNNQPAYSNIISRSNGVLIRSSEGYISTSEALPGAMLGVSVRGSTIEHIPNSIAKKLINASFSDGRTYAIIPLADGTYYASPLKHGKIKEVHARSIVAAVRNFIEGLDEFGAAVQKQMGIDLSTSLGLQTYVRMFVNDYNVPSEFDNHTGYQSPLGAFADREKASDFYGFSLTGNGVSFARGKKAGGIDLTLTKNSPQKKKAELYARLYHHLQQMYFHVDNASMGKELKIPLETETDEGTGARKIETVETKYDDVVKENTLSDLISFNIGTEENPNWVYQIQPVIAFNSETFGISNKEKEDSESNIIPIDSTKRIVLTEKGPVAEYLKGKNWIPYSPTSAVGNKLLRTYNRTEGDIAPDVEPVDNPETSTEATVKKLEKLGFSFYETDGTWDLSYSEEGIVAERLSSLQEAIDSAFNILEIINRELEDKSLPDTIQDIDEVEARSITEITGYPVTAEQAMNVRLGNSKWSDYVTLREEIDQDYLAEEAVIDIREAQSITEITGVEVTAEQAKQVRLGNATWEELIQDPETTEGLADIDEQSIVPEENGALEDGSNLWDLDIEDIDESPFGKKQVEAVEQSIATLLLIPGLTPSQQDSMVRTAAERVVRAVLSKHRLGVDTTILEETAFDEMKAELEAIVSRTKAAIPKLTEAQAQRAQAGIDNIQIYLDNWGTFASDPNSLVNRYLKKRTGVDQTTIKTLDEQDTVTPDGAQTWSTHAAYTVDAKDTSSARLKMLLSFIPDRLANGKPRRNYLKFQSYVPYDTVFDNLSAWLSGSYPDIDQMRNTLKELEATNPWVTNLLETLANASEQQINDFVTTMSRHYVYMKFINWNVKKGRYTMQVLADDSVAVAAVVRQTWLNTLITNKNGLIVVKDDDYWVDPDKAQELVDKLTAYQKTPPTKEEFIDILGQVGISLSDRVIERLMNSKQETTATGRKVHTGVKFRQTPYTYQELFSKKGGFMFHIREALSNPRTLKEKPLSELNLFKGAMLVGKISIMQAQDALGLYSSSFRSGDKTIAAYSHNKYLINRMRELKHLNNDTVRRLGELAYNRHASWLQLLTLPHEDASSTEHLDHNQFMEDFKISYTSLNPLKKSRTSFNPGKLEDMSPAEHEITKLAYFLNMMTTGVQKKNMATYMFSTMPKGTMMMIDSVMEDIKLDENNTVHEDSVDFIINTLVASEVERIYAHQYKQDKNISGYNEGSGMFLLIPELNDISELWDEQHNLIEDKDLIETFKSPIREAIKNHIDKQIEKKRAEWEKFGVGVKNNEFHFIDNRYLKSLEKKGFNPYKKTNAAEKDKVMQKLAADMVVNYMLANHNFSALFWGDPAIYYKQHKKNRRLKKGDPKYDYTADAKATFSNIGKRLAAQIAPGYELSGSVDEKFKVAFLEDRHSQSNPETIEFYKRAGMSEAAIDHYMDIESTDAQEFTTAAEHLHIMFKTGKLDDDIYKEALALVEKGKDLSTELLGKVLQPMKPVYVQSSIEQGVSLLTYIKSSSFPLLPQLTRGLELDKLRVAMEHPETGVDRVAFSTAVKVGNVTSPLNIWNKDGSIVDNIVFDNTNIRTLSRDGFRIQQDIPTKDKNKVNVGTQERKLFFMDIAGLFPTALARYNQIYNDVWQKAQTKLYSDLNYDPKDGRLDIAALQKILYDEAVDREYNINDLIGLTLVQDEANQYNFKAPLWSLPGAKKIESLLMSLVDNRIRKILFTGKSLVLATEEGVKIDDEAPLPSDIVFTSSWNKNSLQHTRVENGEIKASQIIIKWPFKQKMSDFFIPGTTTIDETKLPTDLLHTFGFRIPTQGPNSMARIEIVGFLPEASGDLVIASRDLVVQMGSDFDIDKLTLYLYDTEVKEGKLVKKDTPQNEILDIHLNILATDNNEVQRLVHAPLVSGDLEVLAESIAGMREAKIEEDIPFSPMSDSYNREQYISNNQGETGIGVFALDITMHATLQQARELSGKEVKIMSGDEAPFELVFGDEVSSGQLGEKMTLDGKQRISSIISEFLSAAVDNVKEQILGRINANQQTFNAFKVLNLLGFTPETSIAFLNQPIITDYIETLRGLQSSVSGFITNPEQEAFLRVRGKYEIAAELPEGATVASELADVGSEKLMQFIALEDMMPDFNQSQIALLDKFQSIDGIGKTIASVQSTLNIDSGGVGKSLMTGVEKHYRLLRLPNHGLLQNIDTLVGDYLTLDTKDAPDGFVYVGDVEAFDNQTKSRVTKYVHISPTTVNGMAAVYALSAVKGLYMNDHTSKLFPYDGSAIQNIFQEIEAVTNAEQSSLGQMVTRREKIFEAIKSYLFTTELDLYFEEVTEQRSKLFIDSKTNKSLATILLELKDDPIYKNNHFLSGLHFVENKNGEPSLIKFNATKEAVDEELIYGHFAKLLTDNRPLSNGMSTRQLAKDLIAYTYLSGGVQQAIQFAKYIPAEYLNQIGFFQTLSKINFNDGSQFGMLTSTADYAVSAFTRQYMQHNPRQAPDVTKTANQKNFDKLDSFVPDNSLLVTKEANIEGKTVVTQSFLPFIQLATEKDTYLYQYDGGKYVKISQLGTFGMLEYNARTNDQHSTIKSRKTRTTWEGYQLPAPSAMEVGVPDIDISEEAKPKGPITRASIIEDYQLDNPDPLAVLEQIQNFSTNKNYVLLAKKLAKTIEEGKFSFNIKVDNRLKARGQTGYNLSKNIAEITINQAWHKNVEELEKTILHEIIHAATKKLIVEYRKGTLEGHQSARMKKIDDFKSFFIAKMEAKYTKEGLEEILENLEGDKIEVEYASKNLEEFIALAMTSPKFQEFMDSEIWQGDKSWLQKFTDLLKSLLATYGIKFESKLGKEIFDEILDLIEDVPYATPDIIKSDPAAANQAQLEEAKHEVISKPVEQTQKAQQVIHKGPIVFTDEQNAAIAAAKEFLKSGNPAEFFLLEGKAGTGKTTIAGEIIKQAGRGVHVAALSHKAKGVIRDKFKDLKVEAEFVTLAGLLGFKMDQETGKFTKDLANKYPPIAYASVIVIDEASMVNEELMGYIFRDKMPSAKVIFLGDVGQLPPIRTRQNPYYRNKEQLFGKKSPVFAGKNKATLATRIRQGEESPILPFADNFWENSQKTSPEKQPAPERESSIKDKGALVFTNTFKMIQKDILEAFKNAIANNTPNHIKVVSYRNRTRQAVNTFIHNNIFGENSEQFMKGELIIFNSAYGKIENSTETQIDEISEVETSAEGYKYVIIKFRYDNVTESAVVILKESAVQWKQDVNKAFKTAFASKGSASYRMLLDKAWTLSARFANVDYGYAITSHKSQGSTYDIVVVDEQDIMSVGPTTSGNKSESIYTALTRASNVAIVISAVPVPEVPINAEELHQRIEHKKRENQETPRSGGFYVGDIIPATDTVFVFGSNPEGRHGKGAARTARLQFGAKSGVGEGMQGNAYAIPTKDLRIKVDKGAKSVSPTKIVASIRRMYEEASTNPGKKFKVAYRNTEEKSLNGYTGIEMIQMFIAAGTIPSNVMFSQEWKDTGLFNTPDLMPTGDAASSNAQEDRFIRVSKRLKKRVHNLETYLVQVKAEFKKTHDRALAAEMQRIQRNLDLLETQLEEASEITKVEEVTSILKQRLEVITKILSRDGISANELYDMKQELEWISALGTFRDEERHILFTPDEVKSESLRREFGEYKSQAESLLINLNFISKDHITAWASETLGRSVSKKDILGAMQDVGKFSAYMLDITRVDDTLLAVIAMEMKKANFLAQEEAIGIVTNIDEILERVGPKLRGINANDPFDIYIQRDPDGKKNGNLVYQYAQAYFEQRNLPRRKYLSQRGKKGEEKALKEYKDWMRENEIMFDARLLLPTKDDATYQFKYQYSKAKVDAHIAELKEHLGEHLYEKMHKYFEESVERFTINYEAHVDEVLSSNMTQEEKDQSIDQYDKENSPYWAAQHVFGDMPVRLKNGGFARIKGYSNTYTAPKKFKEDENGVRTDTGWYDANYLKIEQDPDLLEFYEYVLEQLYMLRSVLPEHKRKQLQINSLPFIKKDIIELFSEKGMKVGLPNKLWTTFKESVRSDDISESDYAERDPDTGQLEPKVQLKVTDENAMVRRIYNLRINQFRAEQRAATESNIADVMAKYNLSDHPTFVAYKKNHVTFEKLQEVLKGRNGKDGRSVRVAITKMAKQEVIKNKSFDLGKVIKAYAMAVLAYKHKAKVEALINLATDLATEREELVTNSASKNKSNSEGTLSETGKLENLTKMAHHQRAGFFDMGRYNVEGKTETKILTPEEKQIKAQLESLLKDPNLTPEEKVSLQTQLDNLGGVLTGSNVGDTGLKYVQLMGMGWNLFSGFLNTSIGQFGNLIEAADGRLFNMNEYGRALNKVKASIGKNLSFNTIEFGEAKKIRFLMDRFDFAKDASDEFYKTSNKSIISRKFRWLHPWQVQKRTEYVNQAPIMVAIMLRTKISDLLPEHKGEEALWEAYDENGMWKVDKYGPEPRNEFFKIKNKVDQAISRIHGNYNFDLPQMGKKFFWFRALMQFKTWLPESFAIRFEAAKHDELLGIVRKGRYVTYWDIFAKGQGTKEGVEAMDTVSTIFFTLKQLLRKMVSVVPGVNLKTQFDQKFNEVDAANMRANLQELVLIASLYGVAVLLRGLAGDDDDKVLATILLNQMTRLQTDVLLYSNPWSLKTLTDNALPITGLLRNSGEWFVAAGRFVQGDDILASGPNKGDGRFLRETMQAFPGTSQMYRLYNAGQQQYRR